MLVFVRNHAISRYRKRYFDFQSSNEEIRQRLEQVVHQGRVVRRRRNRPGKFYEMEHEGVVVIVEHRPALRIVRTCLCSADYRAWLRESSRKK